MSREDFKNPSSIFLCNYPQIFGIIYFTFFLLFEYKTADLYLRDFVLFSGVEIGAVFICKTFKQTKKAKILIIQYAVLFGRSI